MRTESEKRIKCGGACGGNTRDSLRSKVCIRAERGVCKPVVSTRPGKHARDEHNVFAGAVHHVCALPQSVPTV